MPDRWLWIFTAAFVFNDVLRYFQFQFESVVSSVVLVDRLKSNVEIYKLKPYT